MGIVALDPGGTTGWAVFNDEHDWHRGQFPGTAHHESLWNMLHSFKPEVIVCERFQYQRRELDRGVQLNIDAREYIGVAHLYCQLVNTQLVMQTPHQRTVFTDDKLKALGLWIPGLSHAMDATRHLLYYLVVTRGMRELLDPLRPKTDDQTSS